ncbi:FAD-dependent oxidoreductase [Lentzea sp. NBRC 105346]|uniref:FAD-dependent monooxygenase n=1 Tax=Lentzea sp. NBRC 105346 TaxID=3032205 RepID=UPI0024A06574|nr:FAD-dependent monooxygenase [Lentzea sp. NBRC 105346]GLZ32988.1 FAD-dependent oxidoreductase [Lentzea sp. NBRC 105346]
MRTSVLVVGGGLAGSSAAMFLAWRGVPTVLVEKYPGSSLHPRAVGYRARVMELFSAVGLQDEIPQREGPGPSVGRIRVESLAGEWFEEMPWASPAPPPGIEYSPMRGAGLAQDKLEPLLRDKARSFGADIRMSTRMTSFTQDDEGVTAVVEGPEGPYEIRADYLLAADGHRSPVREALGIGRSGRGHLSTSRSVLFRASLDEYLGKGFGQFVIDDLGFLTTYGDGRWVLMLKGDTEYSEEVLREKIFRAIGRSDVDVELITTGRWEVTASVADTFQAGRIFLAGDAAHTLPPSRGGYGASVGIEDGHNLAWKIAAVLDGSSGPELLETYEPERRPVALLSHDQIFAHNDGHDPNGPGDAGPVIDDIAMGFGQLYRSAGIIGAGADLPDALRPDEWAGQPGTRAPHVRMADGRSTLDLLQRGWVLLAEDDRWAAAAKALHIEHHRTGVSEAFGVSEDGASLIRPDGYIAWRSKGMPEDPAGELENAYRQVSFAR